MGMLFYGSSSDPITIEDRALAHLKVAVATKLRRQESFTLTWSCPDTRGVSTIWIHPSIPLRFVFDEPETPPLNARWIDQLMQTASAAGGITLVDEELELQEPTRAR